MNFGEHGQRGFSLIELMVVIGIGLIIAAMAIGGVPSLLKTSRADGGLMELAAAVRGAREMSISNRRNVQMTFGTNSVTLTRVEYCPATCTPGSTGNYASYSGCTSTCTTATTTMRTITLEGLTKFGLVSGLPDTPDLFGNSTAINIGTHTPVMFTTDGSLVDSNGDVVGASLFIAVPNDPLSARAITIFGPTGALHLWRWNGRVWVET